MPEPIQTILGIKVSTLLISFGMAALAVLLDIRRHNFVTAILAVFAGMSVALIGTDFIVEWLTLPPSASYAVAGVLSISGRNIIVFISVVSRDPWHAWEKWKGKK